MITGDEDTGLARLGKAPAEQAAALIRPASLTVWTATEIMHWLGAPGSADVAIATAVASGLTGIAAGLGWVPPRLPLWIALAGGWTAAAWYLGPLAWLPAPLLTAALIIFMWVAHRHARRHPAVAGPREWREQRARWLQVSHEWGLGGTHLIGYEETGPARDPIGERYVVSTRDTGRLASAFCTHANAERIAEAESLPPGRVQIRRHHLAGRIVISVRRRDPWAEPLLHPLAGEDHEVELPERRSIMDPALTGQDPETGAPLPLPLYDRETGGKNIGITGIKGAGKDVLIDNICEHVTACHDALLVRIDVSVKGYAQVHAWGPSCHLTAFGPEQKHRALAVVMLLSQVIEWRARTYRQGAYTPSAGDPAFVLVVNESDSAAATPGLRAALDLIATKGREYGITYVHAGQRNTNDYHSAKQRSQDDVHCTGMLANANEARHAGRTGGVDMAAYGEGHAGVWAIEVLGGTPYTGRTWVFGRTKEAHGAMVEAIAGERAHWQPQLAAACAEYLGNPYAALLASEVFSRWAQDRDPGRPAADDDDTQLDEPPATSWPGSSSEPGTARAVPAGGTATAVADDHDLEQMWKTPMDQAAEAKYAAIREKLTDASRVIAETAAMPSPEPVTPAERAAYIAARWQQFDAEAQIPEEVRPRLLEMLAGGTTASTVASAFSVSKWTARTWLEKLRGQDAAYVDGERKAARWRLAPPPGQDDAQ